jgi:hypothetical protein
VAEIAPQNSQILHANLDSATFPPGNYTLQVDFVSLGGETFALGASPLNIAGPSFQIITAPAYRTFYPGEEASFQFRLKNTGDQEGSAEFRFKAYDLIDSTRRELLKSGEEKDFIFSLTLPTDLEEKDYFADYEVKGGPRGQVKYHLAGVKVNVRPSLDKAYYREGEVARLSLAVSNPSPLPAPLNLFARVNYPGFGSKQAFTLDGERNLAFDVPLGAISGEKLFFGIYHESGRSLHLNSLFVPKAGEVLTITTDRQVYKPGETVSLSASGNSSGTLTLAAPDYEEKLFFSGTATRSFSLPAVMTAGTYYVEFQLAAGGSYTGRHAFDVEGIQVKITEALLDKARSASSDNIGLSLKIESNRDGPATLKTWIVDPEKGYRATGAETITLSASAPILTRVAIPFTASKLGVHRAVYGIYGPQNLLLCSGSEAFDVGQAVLLGLTTDKRDYPTSGELVEVSAALFGSLEADLELEIDGTLVKTERLNLNQFTTWTTSFQDLPPGTHRLKATLNSGALKSTKEVTFTYALGLVPRPQISASALSHNFGSLQMGSAAPATLAVSSAGNSDLIIAGIALGGGNEGEFIKQLDTCSGTTLAPNATCSLVILFSPSTLGQKSTSLLIRSNAKASPALNLSLTGTGVFSLTVAQNPGGAGKITGPGISCPGDCTENHATSGAAVELTATPKEGYRFVDWTGDVTGTGNPMIVNLDGSKTITANYALNTFTISAGAGPGGSITPSGAVKVGSGGNQTFSAAPAKGYHLTDVRVDGSSVGAAAQYTFTDVRAEHSIEAFFGINQYTIAASSGANGSISPAGVLTVDYGAKPVYKIAANPGYHILDVQVDGESAGAVDTFTFNEVAANHSIEAAFAPGIYSLELPRTGQIARFAHNDDGFTRAGAVWPVPRFTVNPDTTITDNLTALQWIGDASTPDIPMCAGGPKTWGEALTYVDCLNAHAYLGGNDWRLPNVNEMESLIHAGVEDVAAWLNAQGFANVDPAPYWTSTTLTQAADRAWGVSLREGMALYSSKGEAKTVWPVRGSTSGATSISRTGQISSFAPADDGVWNEGAAWPEPRFLSDANTTLIDRLTGLVWPADQSGLSLPCNPGLKTWEEALEYISCLNTNNYLGRNDWRLPNRIELKTLIHFGVSNPLAWLSEKGFVNLASGSLWSSTTYAGSLDNAWALQFSLPGLHVVNKNTPCGLLPVRGGTLIPNLPPHPVPTGGGVYDITTPIHLGGQVSDVDGDLLMYEWLDGDRLLASGQIAAIYGGAPVLLPEFSAPFNLGEHSVMLRTGDGFNPPVTGSLSVKVIDTVAPVLSPVPDKAILWPPNNKMEEVKIRVNAADNSGGPVHLTAFVTSNEPQKGMGKGDQSPDWTEPLIDPGNGIISLKLRAERYGAGNGRVYTITIMGVDSSGNSSRAKVEILVPHDRR